MGLINIDKLCKLDRFRDEYIEGTGKYREVEVLNDEDKVCSIENPTYRKVQVLDGALYDENKKGIIDEMIRQCFEFKEVTIREKGQDVRVPGMYDPLANNNKNLMGAYIKNKLVGEKESPWDTYFLVAQKIYNNSFKSGVAKTDYKNHISEGRYEAINKLIELSKGQYNESFKRLMNFEINNVNDFKTMLKDNELSVSICNYLLKAIQSKSRRLAILGRHPDKLVKQKIINGKAENIAQYFDFLFLDKPVYENGETSYEVITDELANDNIEKIDNDVETVINSDDKLLGTYEDLIDDNTLESIFTYINYNKTNILSEARLKYLKNRLKKGCIKRIDYETSIIKAIEKDLNNKNFILKTSWGYDNRKDIIDTLENILKKDTLEDSFNTLVSEMKSCNSRVESILIDYIYELDIELYKPIVAAITTGEVDNNYINKDFIRIIERLQDAYNFYIQENKRIYNYNKSKDEIRICKFKNWMEENIFYGKSESFVSYTKCNQYCSKKEIKDTYRKIFNKSIRNNSFDEIIMELGYEFSKQTAKKGIHGFKIKKIKPKKEESSIDYTSINDWLSLNNTHGYIAKTKDDKILSFKKFKSLLKGQGIKANFSQMIEILNKCGYKIIKNSQEIIDGKATNVVYITKSEV